MTSGKTIQRSHLIPVYLDEYSGGTEAQIQQINSTLRTEYARFQRASFAKEEAAPLVGKAIKALGAYLYDVTDRSYGKYHTLYFKFDLTTVDAGMDVLVATLEEVYKVPVFQCGTDGDGTEAVEELPGFFYLKDSDLRFSCTTAHAADIYSCYLFWVE